jgi:hypothetical protein
MSSNMLSFRLVSLISISSQSLVTCCMDMHTTPMLNLEACWKHVHMDLYAKEALSCSQ